MSEQQKKKGIKCGILRRRKTVKHEVDAKGQSTEKVIEWTQDRFTFSDFLSFSFWKEVIFDNSMTFYEYWSALMSLLVLYNAFFLLARQTYTQLQKDQTNLWFILDYVSDACYLVDMLVAARIGYIDDGIFVMDPKSTWMHYRKSTQFRIDILSLFPTDLLYFKIGTSYPILRINRTLRISRMEHFFDILESRTAFPNLMRIIHLLVYVMLIIHLNACIYFAISLWHGLGSDNWVYPNDNINFAQLPKDHLYQATIHKYIVSMWWSMLTLTTIGDTDPPETTFAYIYVIMCDMVGVFIFAAIFGNVGAMINNSNLVEDEFRMKRDEVKHYMVSRKVSKVLQDRVVNWFNYTFQTRGTLNETEALTCMPYYLQAEIAMQVHLDTLRKVRLFQDCEPGLLNELVLKLKLQVFSPGDFVCRKGDVGREMYIVKSGKLQVVSEDCTRVFKEFGEGESFGDLSMLTIPGSKHGNKRSANVRSVGFTDLFSLSKDDLLQALEIYPEAKTILIEKASEILRKDGAIDDKLAKLAEMETTEYKVTTIWQNAKKLKSMSDVNRENQQMFEEKYMERVNTVRKSIEDIKNKLNI